MSALFVISYEGGEGGGRPMCNRVDGIRHRHDTFPFDRNGKHASEAEALSQRQRDYGTSVTPAAQMDPSGAATT